MAEPLTRSPAELPAFYIIMIFVYIYIILYILYYIYNIYIYYIIYIYMYICRMCPILVLISLQFFEICCFQTTKSNQSIHDHFKLVPLDLVLPTFNNDEVSGHGTWFSHAQGMLLQGLSNRQSSGGVAGWIHI